MISRRILHAFWDPGSVLLGAAPVSRKSDNAEGPLSTLNRLPEQGTKRQIGALAPHPIQNLEPRLTRSISTRCPSPIRLITFQSLGREMARPSAVPTRGTPLTLTQPATPRPA